MKNILKKLILFLLVLILFSCKYPRLVKVSPEGTIIIKNVPIRSSSFVNVSFALLVEGRIGKNAFAKKKGFQSFLAKYSKDTGEGYIEEATKTIALKLIPPKDIAGMDLTFKEGKLYDTLTLILTNAHFNSDGSLVPGSMQRIVTLRDKMKILDSGDALVYLRPFDIKVAE